MKQNKNSFAQTIKSVYGDRGKQWLDQLPIIIEQCSSKWQLQDLQLHDALTYNYILFGTMDNRPIVLKLRCDQNEFEHELKALQAYRAYPCIKILAYDMPLRAI